MSRTATLAVLLLASAACIPNPGPTMSPGADCMECHAGGDAPHWTVAGTWQHQNQRVAVVDANGKSFSLHTNVVANFWSSEPVAFPLHVSVDGVAMSAPVEASSRGSCNLGGCHAGGAHQ